MVALIRIPTTASAILILPVAKRTSMTKMKSHNKRSNELTTRLNNSNLAHSKLLFEFLPGLLFEDRCVADFI
jgi:hypothetical protein